MEEYIRLLSGVDGALVAAFLAVVNLSYIRPVGDKEAGALRPGLWPLY